MTDCVTIIFWNNPMTVTLEDIFTYQNYSLLDNEISNIHYINWRYYSHSFLEIKHPSILESNISTFDFYFKFKEQSYWRENIWQHEWQRSMTGHNYLYMINKKYHLLSDSTSYASDINLNFSSASSWLFGFLSGCHFRANFRYLMKEFKIRYIFALLFHHEIHLLSIVTLSSNYNKRLQNICYFFFHSQHLPPLPNSKILINIYLIK